MSQTIKNIIEDCGDDNPEIFIPMSIIKKKKINGEFEKDFFPL